MNYINGFSSAVGPSILAPIKTALRRAPGAIMLLSGFIEFTAVLCPISGHP